MTRLLATMIVFAVSTSNVPIVNAAATVEVGTKGLQSDLTMLRNALEGHRYRLAEEYAERAETTVLNTMSLGGSVPTTNGMPATPALQALISARSDILARNDKSAILALAKIGAEAGRPTM